MGKPTSGRSTVTIDANEAVALVAHKLSEVIAIYPITPSTPMAELSDAWTAVNRPNLWGTVPMVVEMQSEGGAAGAIHGALQTGALSTTFTASQGLLLMIPNMYKIAGELTPTVFHVTARSLAAQGLSIFGDHADVMAVRQTGWALIASNSVQEAHDMALISHAATLKTRIPFLHFFDGFRTSHEINKIECLSDEDLATLIDDELVRAHRARGLSPEHPVIRGTAQNPDVYFQGRESSNTFYLDCPGIVEQMMERFAALTGRAYRLFEYVGAPDAERVVIVMGSGAETVEETVKRLEADGEKVGVLKVRLYRPFSIRHFLSALPETVEKIAVLDRTKEPGSAGEPMYLDVAAALQEAVTMGALPRLPRLVGGRYGLSSKEFTPAMVKAVFDELKEESPKNGFTVGIVDDVTHTSLAYDAGYSIETERTVRCLFYGLGSDGTVGANKNSIKIIGEETENYAQGYFVYDSKKSGSVTISHLRFGPDPIRAPYLISEANFIACHNFSFLERLDVLKAAAPGGIFLLNTTHSPETVWSHLPHEAQSAILSKKLRVYVIDAYSVAKATGMGARINTVMQTCFFAISGVLPREMAIAKIKESIKKTYGKRGEAVVAKNFKAVDETLAHLSEVAIPAAAKIDGGARLKPVPDEAPEFVREVLGKMIAFEGDDLPVSAMPVDGTFPTATAKWEKRNIAQVIPVWSADICIQCAKCSLVCPHSVIRQKVYEPAALEGAPEAFQAVNAKFKEFPGAKYTLQVSPEDCTGCGLCVEACPVKDKTNPARRAINMEDQPPLREQEKANWEFFLNLPEVDRTKVALGSVKNSQLLEPLFEFSGACTGCGETPYIKLVSQLFGDRMHVANATGCSSIYGGNLPTTPWTVNGKGRGPAWANSLFEDNAEFGLGMRLAVDKQTEYVREILPNFASLVGTELVDALLNADQSTDAGLLQQRGRVQLLRERLAGDMTSQGRDLMQLSDVLVKRSVWIIGGDGWAYDIGYGGLDHVLATGANVNILVLDTEVYSNTGGQASKSTPVGAIAKFAAKGKDRPKKDMGMIAMAYGYVYVARVAMGANDMQTVKAIMEAEAYDGPSLILAYSHCIAHGIEMHKGLEQQKLAVQSGHWPLYRYDPRLVEQGKNPFQLDAKDPSVAFDQYAYNETRYKMLQQADPTRAEILMAQAQEAIKARWAGLHHLAGTAKADTPAAG